MEIFSLMAFAISIILRKKQDKWREACEPLRRAGRQRCSRPRGGLLCVRPHFTLGPWRILPWSQPFKAHKVIKNRKLQEAQA